MEQELVEMDLWRRFKAGDDPAARDHLVGRYQPWATAIARSVHRRLRTWPVDCDDFIQNAAIGLVEAMARFDPARGVPFQAYARPRVRGAVFNGLRAILADRPATRARFAERLETLQGDEDGDVLQRVIDAVAGLGVGFLLEHAAEPAHRIDGLFHAQSAQLHARLAAAVERLPPRLRALVREHYFEHRLFAEMAEREGITKGRMSQLHREALSRLRRELDDTG
jgi:RNA polymerase sigma factor for flagellar operon FliA